MDTQSLAHSKWRCKYHIVFAPKYRRQVIYGKIKADIGVILRKLCEYKGVEIHEANACPRTYSYVSKYSTENKCGKFCRVFEGKKLFNDIRSPCKFKIQIWQPTILVQGIFCGYSGTKQGGDCEVYQRAITR